MNIYLDIDGVILGVESPIEDLIEFITYILDNFPDSTYWLTTHCRHGENNADRTLKGIYPDELVNRMMSTVKPTSWNTMKTEAIDFTKPFVWFDDNLWVDDFSSFASEKAILKSHDALQSWFEMDPDDPQMAKKALQYLRGL